MEVGQAQLKSSEAAEARNPDGKTLGDDSAAGLGLNDSVDGGRENGLRVSSNGNEVLGYGEFVQTAVLSVESSLAKSNEFVVSGTDCVGVQGSEIDGLGSLLEMGGSVGESGVEDGRGSGESVKEMGFVSGVEEVQEASGGVYGDLHDVPTVDSAARAGVVESKESRMMKMEDDPKGGNVFFVGDFVWGKVMNHPWWPGRIYDPSDASEFAAKHDQKGRFLVAFSDGSFAWCHSSQLKPFADDFEEMSRQSNSKSFVSAVDNALNDIGKIVELEMTCPCALKGNHVEVDRPLANNTGIKKGVFVPEWRSNCSIIEFKPVEIVANLKNVAKVASVASTLDILMLRSTLCAFYQAKGGYQLPGFYEPQQIPGLEDKMEDGALDIVIHYGAVEVPVQGPFEEETLSPRVALVCGESSLTGFLKSPGSWENQLPQRKQKSIAEIIANGGTGSDNMASKSGRRKRKVSSEVNDNSVDTLVSIPAMKESEVSGPFATPGSKVVSENDRSRSDSGAMKRGKKKKGVAVSNVGGNAVAEGKVCAESKEQNEKVYASRERKKSKYLSPPYTNPIQRPQKEELEAESQQVASVPQTGKRMSRTTNHTMECPIVKCSGEVLHTSLSEQLSIGEDSLNISIPDPMIIELPVNDVLSEIHSVALFTLHPEEKAIDRIIEFLHMYRSSTYHEGSHYQSYKQQQQQPGQETKCVSSTKRRGRKRKSINSEAGLLGEHLNQNGNIIPEETKCVSSPKRHGRKRKSINSQAGLLGEHLNQNGDIVPEETKHVSSPKRRGRKRKSINSQAGLLGEHLDQNGDIVPEETKHVSSLKRRGRKRKSINSEAGLLGEHLNQNGDIAPHNKSLERKGDPKLKSRHLVVTSGSETKGESLGSTSLIVTFGPGSSLPTKSELIALYKKFGDLVENETDMFYNNFCACVVFVRTSDAEKAFNSSQESSPFGTANVTFRLKNTLAPSKTQALNEMTALSSKASSSPNRRIKNTTKSSAMEASNSEAPQQNFIKEKLEMMMVMVDQSDGKMSPNLKSTLEGEMRGLLEKMNGMG